MKTIFIFFICLASSNLAFSQLFFEKLALPQDTFWNGSDQSGGMFIGNLSYNYFYPNVYNTDSGGFWESGWAFSTMNDTITSGPENQYSAKPGRLFPTDTYAVAQKNTGLRVYFAGQHQFLSLSITNSTYTYNSMRDGYMSAKKFGGVSGDDPDFLKLTIHGFYNNTKILDSIEFYLADFRFEDNSQDYILDTWKEVDFTGHFELMDADSLFFSLMSSDTSNGLINTPHFFCLDAIGVLLFDTNELDNSYSKINLSPNPSANFLQVDFPQIFPQLALDILDARGARVFSKEISYQAKDTIDISALPSGIYFLRIQGKQQFVKKFIKL